MTSSDNSKPRIGFAGIGLMGQRMAPHFLAKGYVLTVWNRTEEKCAPLRAQGAHVAVNPKSLAIASDVVFACVSDPAAVERLVFADDGLIHGVRPGFRYIETSTIDPALAKKIDAAMEKHGAAMLEAPVTGSKNGAQNGTLLMMTGGVRALHDELLPLLQVIASRAIYCGEMGAGSFVKLLGNTYISFMLEALAETSVLAKKADIPLETVLEVVMASGFASPYYNFKGGALIKRDFDQHFSIDLLVKDQNLMLQEAKTLGAPMPGLVAIRDVCQAARDQGHGQDDIIGVAKTLERAAGIK
ncbi:MAG: NAD(P)-dependent oxidoreductase [Vicinamibacteria bacterium]